MSIRDIMKCLKCNLPIYTTGCGPQTCTIKDNYIKATLQDAMMEGDIRRYVWLKEVSPRRFTPYTELEVKSQEQIFFQSLRDDGWEQDLEWKNNVSRMETELDWKTVLTDRINRHRETTKQYIFHNMKQIRYILGRETRYICTFVQTVKLDDSTRTHCHHIAISPYSWNEYDDVPLFENRMNRATQHLLEYDYYHITFNNEPLKK
jgi:hypothetical protein